MKDKTYKFMILTGKYYPNENIQSNDLWLYFYQHNDQGQLIYHENSIQGIIKNER